MVDAVGGSAISTQLQAATTLNIVALKAEREQSDAVVRNLDQSAQIARADTESGRGRNVDIRV